MSANSNKPATSQILTFVLGNEFFGVHILRVQEIRGWSPVTRIPHSPPHVLGVMSLRGGVVPIFDLRKRFELPLVEYNALTVIIVVTLCSAAGQREAGLVVDGVTDVVDVDPVNLRPAPDVGASKTTDFVSGLLQSNERMIVLLDIDRLIGPSIPATDSAARAPWPN